MEEEAHIPRGSDTIWQYLDIYLFSNGQHQTPPRKYHLPSVDLESWSKILKTLAKEQYGTIISSINLYTVDGQKVLTPMELTHGGAYVAVPLRDTFIPAGYSEYLLKASRSRERRKSKNWTLNEFHHQEVDNKDKLDIEAKERTTLEEEREISSEVLADPAKTTQLENITTCKIINSPKQNERRLSNGKISVIKKNSTLISPTLRRTSMKTRDSVSKKNLKVTTNNPINSGSSLINHNNALIHPRPKTITRTNKSGDRESTPVISTALPIIDENTPSTFLNTCKSHEKNVITESTALENIIDDKELIVVKNPDSEMTTIMLERDKSASVFTKQTSFGPVPLPTEEKNKSELIRCDVAVIDNFVENVYDPDKIMATNIKSKNKIESKFHSDVSEKSQKENDNVVDGVASVADRTAVVNFNLKIEVTKGEGTTLCPHFDVCPTKLCISEKCSQTNIDQISINCATKTSSKKLNNPVKGELNQKVVVVHCACCGRHNFKEILANIDSTNLKLDDTNYVILLPRPQHEHDECLNNCDLNKHNSDNRKSVPNPIKKVYAAHDVHENCTEKIESDIEEKEKFLSGTKLDRTVSISNLEVKPRNNNQTVETQNTESLSTWNSAARAPAKSKTDSTVQTDWCSMLLEARRHEDGRYSFYLPPLNVLKYYGF